jgi:pyruvate formate lyase activating enzyme
VQNDSVTQDKSTVPTRYWHKVKEAGQSGDRVQCDLCPRYCVLKPGQRGFCYVRGNLDGQIVLTTYGRSSGFCIDPIEKKPLNHFLPGTPVLSFGTAGCNLGCRFCQNWDISKSREMDRLMSFASPETIARSAREHQCRSVAYTYNDPVIFHEYALDVAHACHEQDIKSVAVTAGYICEQPREEFFSVMDAANIDLKAFTEEFYKKQTGSHLQPVLDTLEYLYHETDVWFEITTLLIPGLNDSEAEIEAMIQWGIEHLGPEVPWHFTAFHPDYKLNNTDPTPKSSLLNARNIARKNGFYYVYAGNVHDKQSGSTWCHQCGQLLIGRDWYELSDWNLTETGCCNVCGTKCHGLFEANAGQWGSRRQPISLSV